MKEQQYFSFEQKENSERDNSQSQENSSANAKPIDANLIDMDDEDTPIQAPEH